ncbi:MAG: GNAT family N-acetyltransferase [Kiritimatiellia bacterium]
MIPSPFHFRLVGSDSDLDIIRSIATQIWPETFQRILAPEQIDYMMRMMYAPEVLRRERLEGHTFGLLYDAQTPIGYLQLSAYHPNGTAKLHKLYLLAAYHHRGLGQAMLDYAANLAREQGFSRLILNVNKHNEPAIKAYRRNGFSLAQSVVNDIGNGFVMDDYIFARDL